MITSPPLLSISSTLPSGSSQTKIGSKRNTKSFVPTTAEQARIKFLQAELGSAQARIVQLDASVLDKDNRISILMARVKLLEEENT